MEHTITIGVPYSASPARRTPLYAQLYVQVLVAIVAGGLIGHFAPETGVALKPLGDGFIRLVKMIIAPVIFLTIVTGIAGMRNLGSVGRVAGKAFAYFLFFSTIALIVGLIVANVVQPGAGMNIDPATLETGAVDDYVKKAKDQTIVGFLLGIIPETVAGTFVDGNLLQVLFLAISFGIALSTAGEAARPVVRLFEALGAGFFRLVAIFMRAAPIGSFGAFAFTIGKYGIGSIANLAALVATFYLTSLLFVIVVLGLVARAAGFSIFTLIRYLKAELLLVLRKRVGQFDGQDGARRLSTQHRGAGGAHRLQLQPRWHQHLHDAGRAVHRSGYRHHAQFGRSAAFAWRRDAQQQGRRGCDRSRLHHAGSYAVDRAQRADCRHGADPWH